MTISRVGAPIVSLRAPEPNVHVSRHPVCENAIVSKRVKSAGLRGTGPLKPGTPLHEIEFAPGSVWYANPKAVSHQIVYGGGAYFEQWTIDVEDCQCQSCIIEDLGLKVPNLRTAAPAAAA